MINLYSIRPKGFNIGNDVIYLGVCHFVRQAFKENFNIISLPATSKYEAHKKSGISSQTVYEVNQFGDGLIVGGGNLYENGELEVNPIALKALEKPMMIFSVSRGRIYNKSLELVNRTDTMPDDRISILNSYSAISLSRDKSTKQYIDNLGHPENILGSCPTLFINEIPQHIVPLLNSDKTDALISIRTPSLMSIPVSYQYKFRDDLLQMIEVLKESGYKNVKLLCHDHRDIPFAASITNVSYVYTDDVYTYLSLLRNTRLNVTFRLHSFLPCLAYNVPAIKFSYDERAMSMMDTIGMDQWNINYVKQDPIVEFKNRVKNIQELDTIKANLNKNLWPAFRETIMTSTNKFAELVHERRG
ncbi:polysaccharide pyruvyl transferase family protein [Peredibacter starrii]|uniref:Polysaccharide pyruvyl transferase family protein n=1 Tax=Peredibacter starrii TaxID=28202 RepID=A0AAX4HRL8_9BACT|nr:polysaccharide pyruvyl transferase family protein [Peredibacter starrii]WPU65832.1 polysaccharide pyruvyl transferase family protein [Peredibacter starrii]